MKNCTDIITDHFSGEYHLPINPNTELVPTGYEPTTLKSMAEMLGWVGTQIEFDRTIDADGTLLKIGLSFDRNISGFYHCGKEYRLQESTSGLLIACRSIVEITAVSESNNKTKLQDKEFYFVDEVGRHKGVISWLELIAEGAQIITYKAFIASQIPNMPMQEQL